MLGQDCLAKGAYARTTALAISLVRCYAIGKWDARKLLSRGTIAALLEATGGVVPEEQLLNAFYQLRDALARFLRRIMSYRRLGDPRAAA